MAMDAADRRPQLPALSYLDIDKVKREEEAYQNRNTGAPPTLPAVTAASPTYSYPAGPPPPYSQPHSASHGTNIWSNPQSGVHTPTESRQASGDEPDAKQATRQSLPSISEALGVDNQASYQSSAPMSAPSASAHQSLPQFTAPPSPASGTKRSYPMEPPPAPQASQTSFSHFRPEPSLQQHAAASEPSRAMYATERPPLHVQTSEVSAAGPQGVPYGYIPYPPRYNQPTPPSSVSAGPIYQPSAAYAAPSTPGWKSDGVRFGVDDRGPGDYSASVKRHLDMYDLEGSLDHIAQTSGILLDFSRRYGDRLHQSARSGLSLSTLPGLVEVDDMIAKSRAQVESLLKIREVVITQQAAYEQHVADQHHKGFSEVPMPNVIIDQDSEDAKVGMTGSDSKKRRGRAAPPGRCHSCNRAETPEWRRGPDGARTLCNACGLHYAKLTRKQAGANKPSAGSSNLRPKEG